MLRGDLFSHRLTLKREKASIMASILGEIHELEVSHKQRVEAATFQSLQQKIFKLYSLLDQAFLKHKECAQRALYEYGDKCSGARTCLVSMKQSRWFISKVQQGLVYVNSFYFL